MKKRYVFLIIITLLIGVPMLSFMSSKQEEKKIVRNIADSNTTKELIEQYIRKYDPNAFTEKGIIKSYDFDSDTVSHHSLGGLDFFVYLNNDNDLYIQFSINSSGADGLAVESLVLSSKLNDMLDGKWYGEVYW